MATDFGSIYGDVPFAAYPYPYGKDRGRTLQDIASTSAGLRSLVAYHRYADNPWIKQALGLFLSDPGVKEQIATLVDGMLVVNR